MAQRLAIPLDADRALGGKPCGPLPQRAGRIRPTPAPGTIVTTPVVYRFPETLEVNNPDRFVASEMTGLFTARIDLAANRDKRADGEHRPDPRFPARALWPAGRRKGGGNSHEQTRHRHPAREPRHWATRATSISSKACVASTCHVWCRGWSRLGTASVRQWARVPPPSRICSVLSVRSPAAQLARRMIAQHSVHDVERITAFL